MVHSTLCSLILTDSVHLAATGLAASSTLNLILASASPFS